MQIQVSFLISDVNNEQMCLEDEPEVDQEEKDLESGELNNPSDFLDFSTTGLSEHLTRLDAVSLSTIFPLPDCFFIASNPK